MCEFAQRELFSPISRSEDLIHPLEVTVQSVSHRAKQPELPGRLDDPEGPIGSAQVVHDSRRLERGHVRELQLIGYPSPSPGRSQKARTSRLRCSSASPCSGCSW